MTENNNPMAPLRAQIDAFDDQIIALLAQRYTLLAEVVKVKAANNISHCVDARVVEVLERTQKMGVAKGLPPHFMHQLYTLIIDTAHDYERQFLKD
jgi:4-amino-4-deoxychorismate mutase